MLADCVLCIAPDGAGEVLLAVAALAVLEAGRDSGNRGSKADVGHLCAAELLLHVPELALKEGDLPPESRLDGGTELLDDRSLEGLELLGWEAVTHNTLGRHLPTLALHLRWYRLLLDFAA